MKKFLTIVIAVLLAVSCMALVACNKDGDGDGENSILGVYTLTSMVYDGEEQELPEGASSTVELKADGVVVLSETYGGETDSETGSWTQDGDNITITMGEGENAYSVTLVYSNNTLTYSEGLYSQVFTKN